MKFLFEFAPIVVFFLFYKLYGIYAAIIAMIVATLAQLAYSKLKNGKVENTHLFTFILLIIFGGVTLFLRNPSFIMWKVTVFYVVAGLALIVSIFIGSKTLLERMLDKSLNLPKKIWNNITWIWGVGFILIAIVNAYFVRIALVARDNFFNKSGLDPKTDLINIRCEDSNFVELCMLAKTNEQIWVNFKLFGALALTVLLLIFTVFIISKYIK